MKNIDLVNNKKKAIIVDIDDTLSNANHRRKYVESERKDFKKFFDGMTKDSVNEHIKEICNKYPGEVILLTGRNEEYRDWTENWLKENEIKYHYLFMKPDQIKYTKDFIFKENFYHKELKNKFNIEYAIDDREVVLDMWRKVGVKNFHEKEFR